MTAIVHRCALAAAALLTASGGAISAPLDPATCDQLRQELSTLERGGVRVHFDRGAAWAKANLKADQMALIERMLDTEAQFLFRCPQPKRKFDAATESLLENGTGSDPDPDAPKPAAGATAVPAAPVKAPPKAKAKAEKKPKPSDAFVPGPAVKAVAGPAAVTPAAQ